MGVGIELGSGAQSKLLQSGSAAHGRYQVLHDQRPLRPRQVGALGRTDVEFRGFPPAEVEAIQKQLGDKVVVRYPKSMGAVGSGV